MNRTVLRLVTNGFIVLLTALGVYFLPRVLGVPLYREFYQLIIPLEIAILGALVTLFVRGNPKNSKPEKVIKAFFSLHRTQLLFMIIVAIVALWRVSGNEPEQKPKSELDPPKTIIVIPPIHPRIVTLGTTFKFQRHLIYHKYLSPIALWPTGRMIRSF